MDSGGWDHPWLALGNYQVYDQNDYWAVYENHKHIASFWSKQEAKSYVIWKDSQ